MYSDMPLRTANFDVAGKSADMLAAERKQRLHHVWWTCVKKKKSVMKTRHTQTYQTNGCSGDQGHS